MIKLNFLSTNETFCRAAEDHQELLQSPFFTSYSPANTPPVLRGLSRPLIFAGLTPIRYQIDDCLRHRDFDALGSLPGITIVDRGENWTSPFGHITNFGYALGKHERLIPTLSPNGTSIPSGCMPIPFAHASPGDVIYYYKDGHVTHAAIYAGEGFAKSKFGIAHVYRHPIMSIPTAYGNIPKFLKIIEAPLPKPEGSKSTIIMSSFFRYAEANKLLEHHMQQHILQNRGDYVLLSAGAADGREAISAVISWLDSIKKINPHYSGELRVIALDIFEKSFLLFQKNLFSLFKGIDGEIDRLLQYASCASFDNVSCDATDVFPFPPSARISFTEEVINKIKFIPFDLNSPRLAALSEILRIDGFDAILYHTVERYVSDKHGTAAKLASALKKSGLFSRIS